MNTQTDLSDERRHLDQDLSAFELERWGAMHREGLASLASEYAKAAGGFRIQCGRLIQYPRAWRRAGRRKSPDFRRLLERVRLERHKRETCLSDFDLYLADQCGDNAQQA